MSECLSSAVAAVVIFAWFWMKAFKLSDVKLLARCRCYLHVVDAFLKNCTLEQHIPRIHRFVMRQSEEVKAGPTRCADF